MAAATVPQKGPNPQAPKELPRRSDPRPRRAGGLNGYAVRHGDEGRTYKFANPSHQDVGSVAYYEALGYEVETWREEGPELIGARKKMGEPMTFMDQVLMSISKEDAEDIELHGPTGDTGQADADRIEKHIYSRRSARRVLDGVEGIRSRDGGNVFDVDMDTKASRGVSVI